MSGHAPRKNWGCRTDRHVIHEPPSISARNRYQRERPRLRSRGNRLDELAGAVRVPRAGTPASLIYNVFIPPPVHPVVLERQVTRLELPPPPKVAPPEESPNVAVAAPPPPPEVSIAPIQSRRRAKRLRRNRRRGRNHLKRQRLVHWSWGRLSSHHHSSKCRAAP